MEKRDTLKLYNLPSEVKYCKKCTISNQRPRITFDENGICSACNYAEFKHTLDWKQRELELKELCDKHRKNDGSYDVIVPCSGGKDGGFTAHYLKSKYGMNPLLVTWSPLVPTEIGRKNLDALVESGFNLIVGKPNGTINRKLTKLSFEILGDPFQPFIYGQTNFPLTIAVKYGISLIMYGENGEVEYGGDMKGAYIPTKEIKNSDSHYFSNFPPEAWEKYGIEKKDLYPYVAPKHEDIVKNNTEMHFMGYYKKWDSNAMYEYCKENTGFTANDERSEGTYTNFASLDDKLDGFHYYLAYLKFGTGRTTSDTASHIRAGRLTREEGIELIKKYDGEFPKKYLDTFLQYCDITKEELDSVLDSWRSDHLWEKVDGQWQLKNPIWKEKK